MAKSKINLGLITKIIVLVLSAVTILSFFLPAFGPREADETGHRYSNCQVCFLSQDAASEKASDLRIDAAAELAKGNTDEAKKLNEKASTYSLIATIKDAEFEGRASAVTGAWFHFAAAVASLVAILFTLMSMFGKDLSKISVFALIAAGILMIVSLICGIAFLGTEIGSTTIGEDVAFRFGGVILGLITSIIALVIGLIPCLTKKKKSK